MTASRESCAPSRARRDALSRSIIASSASRTSDDWSVRPVNACALTTSASSRAMVVRVGRRASRGTNMVSIDAAIHVTDIDLDNLNHIGYKPCRSTAPSIKARRERDGTAPGPRHR